MRPTTYKGVNASDSKIISIKISYVYMYIVQKSPYLVAGCGGSRQGSSEMIYPEDCRNLKIRGIQWCWDI